VGEVLTGLTPAGQLDVVRREQHRDRSSCPMIAMTVAAIAGSIFLTVTLNEAPS
jgi:hypothetical protein